MLKLFIVGFPRNMKEINLVEMFSIHGQVNTVTIVTDQVSGKSKGYGFITMTDKLAVERSIAALDGVVIEGRQISVRIADDKISLLSKPKSLIPKASYSKVKRVGEEVKKKRPRKRL